MEKGDILFFAAGIITVIVIAILVNPQSISGFLPQVPVATPPPEQTPIPAGPDNHHSPKQGNDSSPTTNGRRAIQDSLF